MKKLVLAVLAAAVPAWASAGAGPEKDSAGLEPLLGEAQRVAQAQALKTQNALKERAETASGPVGLPAPWHAKDVDVLSDIAACKGVEESWRLVPRPRLPTLEEAVSALEPCVRALNAGPAKVSVRKGRWRTPIGPGTDGSTEGIVIQVRFLSGVIGNPLLMNLQKSLEVRDGRLLGFPAMVREGHPNQG
ncbi:MAG: hypothetical protein HY549_05830 [Elusimicrobia bacterium]|nr:hypothetical protein [Elusimicrobiota bacterium]